MKESQLEKVKNDSKNKAKKIKVRFYKSHSVTAKKDKKFQRNVLQTRRF